MDIKDLKGPLHEKQYTNLNFYHRGGMGEIYKATDKNSNKDIAIKIIHIDDVDELKLLKEEAIISQKLSHENIVKTHYADQFSINGNDLFYLVMDFHEKGSLRDLLLKTKEKISLDLAVTHQKKD